MNVGLAIQTVAPMYNLGLAILAIICFMRLFTTPIRERRVYLMPWKIIFVALCIYILEELFTVLRILEVINVPIHINGFFELIIVCTYIYALLLQKEHIKTIHG